MMTKRNSSVIGERKGGVFGFSEMEEFLFLIQPRVYSEIVSLPIEGFWEVRFESDRYRITFCLIIHSDSTSETIGVNCTRAGFVR